MTEDEYLKTLLMLSGVVWLVIDQLKPVLFHRLQTRFALNAVGYEVMVHSVAIVLGLALALAAGNDLNMFAYTDYLAFKPWMGVLASGIAIGAGNKAIEWVVNLRKVVTGFLGGDNEAPAVG